MRVEARDRTTRLSWPSEFARNRRDRDAALVLAALRGITAGRLLRFAETDRTASALLERVRTGGAGSDNDRAAALALGPETVRAEMEAAGARVVFVGEEDYPAELEHLFDPPLALFMRGRPLVAGAVRVAVVGARNCSDLGRDVARDLGRSLAAAGVAVVSGAARGIDAAAHEGALGTGGPTVAVLGRGIDAARAARRLDLVGRIAQDGTVVSEYAPGVPAEPFRFPARNRIVAALSRAVVVVEGEARSGSLISAEHALELGRDVLAVPGAVVNPLSEAPNRLIRDGATLIRGPTDVLHALGVEPAEQTSVAELDLPDAERRALAAVRGSVVPDRVAARLRVPVPEALALLLRLELRGLVRSVGGRFERRAPPKPPAGRGRPDQGVLGRSGAVGRSGGPPVEA